MDTFVDSCVRQTSAAWMEAQFLPGTHTHTNTDGVIEYDGAICGALEGVTGLQSSKNQVFVIGAVGRKARGLESMSHLLLSHRATPLLLICHSLA
ncbi:MAG: hypothetical protein U0103_28270 [Candidatus Obscuribacterales bacterium]